MKQISYVFPVYNEAENIEFLHDTISKTIAPLAKQFSFEFIFINDGSSDDSLENLVAIQKKDSRVVVINLSRNFGQQPAVSAGLQYASGDAAITLDSDLQDPPKVSLQLIEKWQEGFDVVYAVHKSRKDPLWKRATSNWFHAIFSKITELDVAPGTTNFRLLDRKVINELNKLGEHDRFLRGLVHYVGFKQATVPFDRDERHAGKTKYSVTRLIGVAADGVFGFSTFPLRAITRLGFILSVFSVVAILYALYSKFVAHTAVAGWTFVTVSIFLVGGVQLSMLGVVGSYIGRIYRETQNRPLYIVDEVFSSDAKAVKKPHD